MAVKASSSITLSSVVDVKAVYRYYLLQSSTLSKPSKPITNPPSSSWDDTEPTYTEGSTNSLYFVDCTVFSDDTFTYSEVSLSSSYEAAKSAYNKASNAQSSIDNLEIGVRNLLYKSDFSNKISNSMYSYDSSLRMVEITRDATDTSNKGISIAFTDYAKNKLRNAKITLSGEYAVLSALQCGTNCALQCQIEIIRNSTTGGSSQYVSWNGSSAIKTDTVGSWKAFKRTFTVTDYDFSSAVLIIYTRDFVGSVGVRNLKVEFGNKATDWSPAPEDIDAEFENYATTVDVTALIQQKEDAINLTVDKKLEGYSTTAEMNSAIQQRAESILLGVDTRLEDYSTTAEMNSAIELNSNSILSTVSSSYATKGSVESINFGGRNLLLRSDFSDKTNDDVCTYNPSSREVIFTTANTTTSKSLQLTVSDYAKNRIRNSNIVISGECAALSELEFASGTPYFRIGFSITRNTTTGGSTQTVYHDLAEIISSSTTGKWNKFEFTIDVTDYDARTVVSLIQYRYIKGSVGVRNLKIEFGSKATDWTLAPEDYSTTAEMNSAIEQKANSITLTVSRKIDNVSVGGRNLLYNSEGPFEETSTGNYGCWGIGLSTYAHGIKLEPDTDYTLSFDYEIDWGGFTPSIPALGIGHSETIGGYTRDISHSLSYGSCGSFDSVTDDGMPLSGHIIAVFTAPNIDEITARPYFAMRPVRCDTADGLAGATFTITKFKLEKGNKATDWTPAPEDVDADIDAVSGDLAETDKKVDEATSIIRQLSDSIKMLVTDGEGASLMTQTENGWTFSLGSIQDAIDTASEGLSTLQDNLGTTDATVDALNKAVDNLNILGSYIHIIEYEGEPCIELGQAATNFKVLITNTRIMFTEDDAVPTYISNKTLISEKVEITQELHQSNENGSFVWSVRSNGNYGLMWKDLM